MGVDEPHVGNRERSHLLYLHKGVNHYPLSVFGFPTISRSISRISRIFYIHQSVVPKRIVYVHLGLFTQFIPAVNIASMNGNSMLYSSAESRGPLFDFVILRIKDIYTNTTLMHW